MTFLSVIDTVAENLSLEVRSNISAQTCFVVLLHLANEKDLTFEQIGDFNFKILM
jgi:hypothetical protein